MKKRVLIGPLLVLLVWFFVTHFGLVKPIFLPKPFDVAGMLWKMIISGDIVVGSASTLLRVIFAFALGIVVGVPIGLVLGYSEKIYDSMEVVIDFFRSIPVFCLFPLFLLIFGIGDTAKVCTAAWSSSLIILVNTMYGVQHSTKTRRMIAQTMGATKPQILWEVIIPEALPDIVVGMRTGLSLALIVVVVTEMFMGTRIGLGKEIFDASMIYQIPRMYGAILVTGLLGYVLNKTFVLVENRVVHWAGKG